MQCMEHLSDRQAAQAVLPRFDGKYARGLGERDGVRATIGEDGSTLRAGLDQAATQPEWAGLTDLPAGRILKQTWAQQDRQVDGHAQRLTPKAMVPVSAWYRSPYDAEVRYGRKRDFDWIGDKAQLTEWRDG